MNLNILYTHASVLDKQEAIQFVSFCLLSYLV